jgi:Rod binding domain-containing protein
MTVLPPNISTSVPGALPKSDAATDPVHAKLRQAADALDGMFFRQLFSAMRATVPEGDDGLSSAGGTVFNQMLDDTLADHAAAQMRGGLGEALYRQLCARLNPPGGSAQ